MTKQFLKAIEKLRDMGYENICYIGLYGSQNYNLDSESSDFDFRAIVVPTINDLIRNKKTSKTYTYEYGEIDVKDIWTYYQVVRKGNPSFIEPLISSYWSGNEEIRQLFSGFKPNPKAILGMMIQKIKRYVEKKDPKDFLHTARLRDLFSPEGDYISLPNKCYQVYIGNHREEMLKFKTGDLPKHEPQDIYSLFDIEDISNLLEDYTYEYLNKDDEIVEFIKKELGGRYE